MHFGGVPLSPVGQVGFCLGAISKKISSSGVTGNMGGTLSWVGGWMAEVPATVEARRSVIIWVIEFVFVVTRLGNCETSASTVHTVVDVQFEFIHVRPVESLKTVP